MESRTTNLETSSDSTIDSELTTIELNSKTKYLDEHKLQFVHSHTNSNTNELNMDINKLCNFNRPNNKLIKNSTTKVKKVTFNIELNEVYNIPICEKYKRKKYINTDHIIKEGTVDKECLCPIF